MPDIDRCIQTVVGDKTFSAAACIASLGGRIYHRGVYGNPTHPPPLRRLGLDTVFDLSSLTMPLGTGLAALVLASKSRLDLGASVVTTLPELRDKRFAAVTIDMLLEHTSGLPATRPLWRDLEAEDKKRAEPQRILGTAKAVPWFKKQVAETRFECDPGTRVIVSDVGYMVLGWIIEHVVGQPLDAFLEREVFRELGLEKDLFFVRHDEPRAKKGPKYVFAATEDCPWRKKLLVGEVQDPNAWAMGGVAGHAGLFGTVDGVWKLVNAMWDSYRGVGRAFLGGTVRRFWTRSKRLRGTTRTLAWDTPPAHGSMAGKRFALNSVGHLGGIGSSVWLDLSTDILGVVLTNAAHPTADGKQEAMAKFRPRVYELIAKYGEALPPDPAKATGSAAFYTTPMGGAGGNPLANLRKPGR